MDIIFVQEYIKKQGVILWLGWNWMKMRLKWILYKSDESLDTKMSG